MHLGPNVITFRTLLHLGQLLHLGLQQLHRHDAIRGNEWYSPNHCYAKFFLEIPYFTLQGFSEMAHLTGPDFQRIKSLLS